MKSKPAGGQRLIELRRIIGKSQSQFAAMVGVSKHTIISVENGRNKLSGNLARRIRTATGANVLLRSKHKVAFIDGGVYAKADFEAWRARFSSEERSAKARFEEIKYWIELIFRAAAKPGMAGNRDRLPAVYLSLVDWLYETRQAFQLEREIEDILEEDPHEVTSFVFSYDSIKRDPESAEHAAKLLEMQPEELLKLFKREAHGTKPKDEVVIQIFAELRKSWNPNREQALSSAMEFCKVKQILLKPKYQFVKFIHSRGNPAHEQFVEFFRKKDEPSGATSTH